MGLGIGDPVGGRGGPVGWLGGGRRGMVGVGRGGIGGIRIRWRTNATGSQSRGTK